MSSHQELIAEFVAITGIYAERAQFYLEASAWKLNDALSSFMKISVREASTTIQTEQNMEPSTTRVAQSKDYKPTKRILKRTFQTLQEEDTSSDEEKSKRSRLLGQKVLFSGEKINIANNFFRYCKKYAMSEENKSVPRSTTFGGTGYKLGETNDDTEVIEGPPIDQPFNFGEITVKLWKNGFSVNDGELKSYNDTKNIVFLVYIKCGKVPMEIQQQTQESMVLMTMYYYQDQEYNVPKVRSTFPGKGHVLGTTAPAAADITTSTDSSDDAAANEQHARSELNVDANQPTTTIQIRLADGSNVRAQFNLHHTIGDLRRFILNLRPQFKSKKFGTLSIFTAYPLKELKEEKTTISEANLQNSTIVQRLN